MSLGRFAAGIALLLVALAPLTVAAVAVGRRGSEPGRSLVWCGIVDAGRAALVGGSQPRVCLTLGIPRIEQVAGSLTGAIRTVTRSAIGAVGSP